MLHARRVMVVLTMLLLAATLAACGDDSGGGGGGGAADAVVIESFSFSIPTGLDAGATVLVENRDSTTHTFTADDGAFDTGNISGDDAAQITLPTEPGDYAVHCEIHSSMTGTVKVA